MKKLFLAAIMLAWGTFYAKSQTKGTNGIGFGVTSQTIKQENGENFTSSSKQENSNFSLTYGNFIKDNVRIGVTATYGFGSSEGTSSSTNSNDSYGGSLHYQHYYPLLKKFYAFAGARAGYDYTLSKSTPTGSNITLKSQSDTYSVGAYGGAAYFLSKRFAFEAQLLSAGFQYQHQKNSGNISKTKYSALNVSTNGFINNLGFNIYFLF